MKFRARKRIVVYDKNLSLLSCLDNGGGLICTGTEEMSKIISFLFFLPVWVE